MLSKIIYGKTFFYLAFFFISVLIAKAQTGTLQTVVQKGHDQAILSVAVSNDGFYAVTGSRDKSAKLWELSTGREVRTLLGHEGSVNCIDISKDGKYIITSSGDGTAKIWDAYTGKEIYSSAPDEKILTAVAFSHDLKYFITAGYGDNAKVVDMATKKILTTIPVNADQGLGYGINLSLSPDGKWLAVGEDNRVASVFNTTTWKKVFTFNQEQGWCGGCATWVKFTSDNQFLLMASNKGAVKKYSLKDGMLVSQFSEEENDIVSLLLSPDNFQVTLITKKTLIQWDMRSAKEINRITLPEDTEINEATYTSDGKNLLLACADNTVIIWNNEAKKISGRLTGILNQYDKGGVTYNPNSYWESHIARYLRLKNKLLLSKDGKMLLKGKFGTRMRSWNIATGHTQLEYAGHEKAALCYELSKDGKHLLSGGADGKIILWDAVKGDTLKVIQAHREPVFDVHFNTDESKVISSSWDATVKVFDLSTGQRLHYFDFENASAYEVLFSPDDLYVFTAQLDKTLKMYETDTKKVVREFVGHTDIVSSICLSPDRKKLLSAGWDGSIRLWDIATGLMDAKYLGHKGGVYAIRFSHDAKYFFSGGADRHVRMWDTSTGKIVRLFEGHQAEITSILLQPEENLLLSHSTDGVTKFWDLATGKEFFEHIHVSEKDWMVKTTDGYFNGTEGARQVIHFVDGMSTFASDQFFHEFYRPDLLPQLFQMRGDSEKRESIQGRLKSSPPPLVRIATVPQADPLKLEIHVKISDQGGGATALKIFHNGKNLSLQEENLKFPSRKGESATYKQMVDVVGGTNIFTASATSRDNIESEPHSAEYFSEHVSRQSTCYLFAVGINEYKNTRLNLNYAKPDAQSVAQLISEKAQTLFKTIELHTLYDYEASRSKILEQLDELSAKVHPEDVFIFYYAGHGSMVDGHFYFIPAESARLYDIKSLEKEAIEATVLQEKFRKIKALKQLIVMDACQSGSSVELLATRGAGEEKAIAQLSRSAGIHILASAGSEQLAAEFAELKHGLFTYVLIKALEGEADGVPKDGKVTIFELKSYIDDQMPELTRQLKGRPQYPYTFSRGQDFPIVFEK